MRAARTSPVNESASPRAAGLRGGDLARLLKLRLSLMIAAASVAGYFLCQDKISLGVAILFGSVLALSAGAGCLNNLQDRDTDRLFERTRCRPLPAGRISARLALLLAVALLVAGLLGLLAGPFPARAALAAGLAIVCYNGLYTPLKGRTILGLVPGIACGAMPPLIGWLAAGGQALAPPIWVLMAVFGLWQPPHFWLILLAHGDDYSTGPVPPMLALFSKRQLTRLLFVWVTAVGAGLTALPLGASVPSTALAILTLLNATALVGLCGYQLFARKTDPDYKLLFVYLNAAVFIGVALSVLQRMTGRL